MGVDPLFFPGLRTCQHAAMAEGVQEGEAIIEMLGLEPHPEGGWFRRTWRAEAHGSQRPTGSAIYYLLRAGEVSRRHRIDATEIWHHYLGGPLEMVLDPGGPAERRQLLGPAIARGERPQVVVPGGEWQTARPMGTFTLVGCTVSPAFLFDTFELAVQEPGGQGTP